MQSKTIHVFYRTTNSEENGAPPRRYRRHDGKTFFDSPQYERASWFNKRVYFRSIYDDLDENCKLTIIFDGHDNTDWFSFLKNLVEDRNSKFPGTANIDCVILGSRLASLKKLWDLGHDSACDWIYSMEDDYLHKPGWLKVVRKIMDSTKIQEGIFSLYDHMDRYNRTDDVTGGLESINITSYFEEAIHIRSVESTTHSFFLSKEMFLKCEDDFRSHNHDRPLFRTLITKGIRLWQPIPGWNTHDHIEFTSPGVPWKDIAEEIKTKHNL